MTLKETHKLYIEDIEVVCEITILHQPAEAMSLTYPGCDESYEVDEIKILYYDKQKVKEFYYDAAGDDLSMELTYESDGIEWEIYSNGDLDYCAFDAATILDNLNQ